MGAILAPVPIPTTVPEPFSSLVAAWRRTSSSHAAVRMIGHAFARPFGSVWHGVEPRKQTSCRSRIVLRFLVRKARSFGGRKKNCTTSRLHVHVDSCYRLTCPYPCYPPRPPISMLKSCARREVLTSSGAELFPYGRGVGMLPHAAAPNKPSEIQH